MKKYNKKVWSFEKEKNLPRMSKSEAESILVEHISKIRNEKNTTNQEMINDVYYRQFRECR